MTGPEPGRFLGRGRNASQSGVIRSPACSSPQPEPRQATAEEASLLGIQKGSLVTHIRRTYYSDAGYPVETADIVVPAALCEIVYEIPIKR